MPQFNITAPDDTTTTTGTLSSDGVIPPVGEMGNFNEMSMSEEDLHEFVVMCMDMPSMIWGDHLQRTDAQVRRFSHQVYLYCTKKGIDPSDYLFDEFGLVFAGAVLVQGMRKDHAEFKASKGITKKEKKKVKQIKEAQVETLSEEEIEDDPRQTIGGKYEAVESKPQPKDSGSGGDNLPKKERNPNEPREAEDDGLIDFSDNQITDETTIIGGIPV